ncbi:MAG: hypothetical protein JW797_01375 [Bradymonadales bacterium]|nr:hypothetical protein [Bradymonadales bacterium]
MKRSLMIVSLAACTFLLSAQAAAQDWVSAQPLYGTHTLNTGFMPDPQSVTVVAGGAETPQTLGAPENCTGMITAAQPAVRINYTAGSFPLSFFVNSTVDTTLVVNAADGSWHCNDDANGLNPMVRFDAPSSGQYDIWVGVWGSGSTAPANLVISELNPTPLECGTNAQALAGDPGATHFVVCPGACTSNAVWGTGIYSDDSSVCTAAVHAGVTNGQLGGVVAVTIAPGQPGYTPSLANGVTSRAWGAWSRSFTVAPTGLAVQTGATALECNTTAGSLAGDPGATHRVTCPANCTTGSVWGTSIYSDDSSICRAAIHAGVINQATGGELTVTIAPGQPEYASSTANGITTSTWGSWSRSFTVAP